MRKLLCIILVMIMVCMVFAVTGCSKTQGDKAYQSDRFKVVESTHGAEYYTETVFYDTETGVMYLGVRAGSQLAMTVLLNADGTPMVYEP